MRFLTVHEIFIYLFIYLFIINLWFITNKRAIHTGNKKKKKKKRIYY